MPVDLKIDGLDELERLGRQIKETGDKGLNREVLRAMNRVTKPAKAAVKEAARRDLPHAGGLNEVIASARIATRTRTSGRNPSVFLTGAKSGHDLQAIDRGQIKHPVFGRPVWVSQVIEPGWWSQTLVGLAPVMHHEVVQALEDVAKGMTRG